MGVLDFLVEWEIGTIIVAAAVLAILALAGSYGLALGWRAWKDARRRKARARALAARRGGPPGSAEETPRGARGAGLAARLGRRRRGN